MGRHGGSHRGGGWSGGHRVSGPGGPGHGGPGPFPGGGNPPSSPPRPRPVVWATALAAGGVWSLLTWGAYGLVDGALLVRVTAAGADSTLARIARMVEDATASRGRTQRFIERFSAWWTPGAMAASALVALMPPLLLGDD